MALLTSLHVLHFLILLLTAQMASAETASVCGTSMFTTEIVDGFMNASEGRWPWQASIYHGEMLKCGGSLINSQWILSAAHCFYSTDPSLWTVYLGHVTNLYGVPSEVPRNVSQIVVHPNHTGYDNDIALLRLEFPVVFTDFIRPVCLAASDSTFSNETVSWTVGWGYYGYEPYSKTFQETEGLVLGKGQCNCSFSWLNVSDNMICSSVCQSEPGNPMVSIQNSVWVQSGIVSYGYYCYPYSVPGVYTRVSSYESWILSVITIDPPGFVTFLSNMTDTDSNFSCAYPTPSPVTPPPRPFYPYGSLIYPVDFPFYGSFYSIFTEITFPFFGGTYRQIYLNTNGVLTFGLPSDLSTPRQFPLYSTKDIIAPFWTNLNTQGGSISFSQVTSGSVVQQATSDINLYFPGLNFAANWVFTATWDRVTFYQMPDTEATFQVVLISDGTLSFVLMNYGNISATNMSVEAGYDTVNSTSYFNIPGLFQGNITNLSINSNVNEMGRWAFRTDNCPNNCLFNGNLYPFGVTNGDALNRVSEFGGYSQILLNDTFPYFGRSYQQLYIQNYGLLTFAMPWYYGYYYYYYYPYYYSNYDIIAPFWTYLDSELNGIISYREVTSGSVLQQATSDINQYFPQLDFTATWLFIATWDRVAYPYMPGTENSFQVVLISNGSLSFVMMNYGRVTPTPWFSVQAGYRTSNSQQNFVIPYYDVTNLTFSSNVNVPGRWVFQTFCPKEYKAVLRFHLTSPNGQLNTRDPAWQQMVIQSLFSSLPVYNGTCST